MATSFDALKKSRGGKSLDKLNEQLNKISGNNYDNDDKSKYWKPTKDSAGNGQAIIRFLPAPAGEDVPFQRIFSHGFQGPGGWYIEKSLTTIGQQDPVGEFNQKLWNASGDDDSQERKQARKQKRRLKYVSNIYIIKDFGNPENDGKVFLFEYGAKIFDKLKDMMNPTFEGEEPVDPFNLWEGSNFRLKVRQFEGYPNYDKSSFDDPSALSDDDDKLEGIWKQCHSLSELVDPKNFKSYDELQAKLHRVLGITGNTAKKAAASQSAEEDIDDDLDMSSLSNAGKEAEEPQMAEAQSSLDSSSGDDDDDDLEFFKNLAKG